MKEAMSCFAVSQGKGGAGGKEDRVGSGGEERRREMEGRKEGRGRRKREPE